MYLTFKATDVFPIGYQPYLLHSYFQTLDTIHLTLISVAFPLYYSWHCKLVPDRLEEVDYSESLKALYLFIAWQ